MHHCVCKDFKIRKKLKQINFSMFKKQMHLPYELVGHRRRVQTLHYRKMRSNGSIQ